MPEGPYDPRSNLETTGFTNAALAERYYRARPKPPSTLLDLIQTYPTARLNLVVDLGSGTGLSTFPWAGRAPRVIGVEPSAPMRAVAEAPARAASHRNVTFVDGTGDATELPAGSAQIVTCAQALHYMEPNATLAEVNRILVAGRVFVAYDYDWMPRMGLEVEQAYQRYRDLLGEHWVRLGLHERQHAWDKESHLKRLRDSGYFREVRESVLVAEDDGSAVRLMDLARAIGEDSLIREAGVTESELGLDLLEEVATRTFGNRVTTWLWTYHIRVGFK